MIGDKLYNYIDDNFDENKENYVLIDEIQKCNGFEDVINSIHAEEKYYIYITGSNAFLLSSDLATLFKGKTFEIKIYPFSFEECMKYFNYDNHYLALYIQVTDNLESEKVLNRKTTPLLNIRDGYKKIIIAKLNHEGYIKEGIEIIDIADWLLNK